ncbi:cobyrinate a,c-diamide synthase [Lutispora thermophila]|uniref:Cobyrinate a,c-diamide synthase n=1 Tax=Lutispora thermophila DSM 19022 TaxID=1122184 RepID=A0A1M6D497_9FIRM|nr:cobyrinate a,c-diamide synthase [Lutispora thermophila]SHI67913.1 hydrogenobyrinic acid a,c-diamide synthase (glutamine-hydrolysing) [Lutispora thermophila DSM 19022]
MSIPKIVIAGSNSGCGKTTVSIGIMGALSAEGLTVQPFKVGPDYIDPMFHTFVTGNASRNLDSWMMDESTVSHIFLRNISNADIAVIEGVMGMYDGYGGYDGVGSTAHVAKIIDAPVILVVNGEGMSLSIVPLIKGFMDFDEGVKIRGVIINNIKSEAHFRLLKDTIEDHLDITVIGYLKNMPEISLASRHLGLVPEDEIGDLKQKVTLLSEELKKTVDLELLQKIAVEGVMFDKEKTEVLEHDVRFSVKPLSSVVRIAVARDNAFNFYYRDNLDLLEMLGAELVYFSPLNDIQLPDGISGLYLGGGYPEVFAARLEENTSMRKSIRSRIMSGLPTYAECGGLMYLSEGIINSNGEIYSMAGVIPGISRMTKSLQRFGYIEIDIVEDNVLAVKGEKIRGHEFHYSITEVNEDIPTCYSIKKSKRNSETRIWKCGFKLHNLLAGYPHLHFWSNPSFAERFVKSCLGFGEKR